MNSESFTLDSKDMVSTKDASKYSRNRSSIYFSEFVEILNQLEKCKGITNRDLAKQTLIDLFIRIINDYPQDFTKIYYFLTYKVGPAYLIPNLTIKHDILESLVQKLYNTPHYYILNNLKNLGDLGLVASKIKEENERAMPGRKITEEKIKLSELMATLEEAALETDNKNQNYKHKLIFDLMIKTNKDEIKYLIRFLEKNLRLGISPTLVFQSISKAITSILKNVFDTDIYKTMMKSFNQLVDEDILFDHIIELIEKRANFNQLTNLCQMRCGVPIGYQLAEFSTGIKSMVKEFNKQPFTLESNYNGMKCQIHCNKDKIQIFSKNYEDITDKYPEIVGYVSIFIAKSKEKTKKDIKSFI